MAQLTLFDEEDRPPQAARLGPRLRALADQGIYFGTSSWKYEGWLGSIYRPGRYSTRGRFSASRFEAECLAEYAETFPAVCGDFSFYQFPSPDSWRRLFGEVPASFQFAFKVPEEITVAAWPRHARYGTRAGQANASFLDARICSSVEFAAPLAAVPGPGRDPDLRVRDHPAERPSPRRRVRRAARRLPRGPAGRLSLCGRVRNPEYLSPGYFAMLAAPRRRPRFNAWTRMPPTRRPGRVARGLHGRFHGRPRPAPPGRTYEQAVSRFSPYRARPASPTRQRATPSVRIADRCAPAGKPAYRVRQQPPRRPCADDHRGRRRSPRARVA